MKSGESVNETIDRRVGFHVHPHARLHTKSKAICATYSPEIPFQAHIQMAHAATDTLGAIDNCGATCTRRARKSMWRKGDAKMGSAFDAWPVIEIVQEAKEEGRRETEMGKGREGT